MEVAKLTVWAWCILAACQVWGQRKPKEPTSNYLHRTKSAEEIRATENKMEKLYYMFCGEFTNKAQADTSKIPAFSVRQEVISVPIWTERKGEYWFYMGWYKFGQPEQSLLQGICRLTKDSRDTFRITTYALPNEKENDYYSLEWKKENPFHDLRPKDLIAHEGCSSLLVESGANEFRMFSDGEPCPRNISDALQYFELQGLMTPEILLWSSYFYNKDLEIILNYEKLGNSIRVRTPKEDALYAQPPAKPTKHK